MDVPTGPSAPDRSILVVDDDDDLAAALLDGLTAAGYTAARSIHGQAALDRLRTGVLPDVILLDLMMPVMDGWQLCEALAADPRLAAIPVIIMTASGRAGGSPAHARVLVRKPFGWDALLPILARLVSLPP